MVVGTVGAVVGGLGFAVAGEHAVAIVAGLEFLDHFLHFGLLVGGEDGGDFAVGFFVDLSHALNFIMMNGLHLVIGVGEDRFDFGLLVGGELEALGETIEQVLLHLLGTGRLGEMRVPSDGEGGAGGDAREEDDGEDEPGS